MDYSSLPNDPDHPAGASPWGSSSPGPIKSGSERSEPDSGPPSPTPGQSQSVAEPAILEPAIPEPVIPEPQLREDVNADDSEGLAWPVTEDLPIRNGRNPGRSAYPPIPEMRIQEAPMTEEEIRQKQLQHQRQQERYQAALNAQHKASGPNRYHQTGRQGQPKQPPQYKLQAKITALDRTGKKDPSIRFDVHVSSMAVFQNVKLMKNRQISPNSVPLKSATSNAHIRNLPS